MAEKFDALVIGAGCSGLIAALEIAMTGRTVAVLEVTGRCGGRVHTINAEGYCSELGAEFVHGHLPITFELIKKAGLKTQKVSGSTWRFKEGSLKQQTGFIEHIDEFIKRAEGLEADASVANFLATYFGEAAYEKLREGLTKYVEGYYAADTMKSSTKALLKELTEGEDTNFRIVNGYAPLVNYLEAQCRNYGVAFFLNAEVSRLEWKKDEVFAVTPKQSFKAAKILVTVSIGVLQSDSLKFLPALPEKKAAALQLGFGHVVKVNLLFAEAFWKRAPFTSGHSLDRLSFLFSDEEIPTWWTQHPAGDPLLVGWLGGPAAKELNQLSDDELIQKSVQSLSIIFGTTVSELTKLLKRAAVHNWSADARVQGAYSYEVVNGKTFSDIVETPVEDTLFFSGEGLFQGPSIGTVEAALTTGREAAYKMIAGFPKPA